MRMLGAEVVEVTLGHGVLKDAINEALRDWVTNVKDTIICSAPVAAGPHPFSPWCATSKRSSERKRNGGCSWYGIDHPNAICACVGGGSNAIGIMNAFLDDEQSEPVRLRGRR